MHAFARVHIDFVPSSCQLLASKLTKCSRKDENDSQDYLHMRFVCLNYIHISIYGWKGIFNFFVANWTWYGIAINLALALLFCFKINWAKFELSFKQTRDLVVLWVITFLRTVSKFCVAISILFKKRQKISKINRSFPAKHRTHASADSGESLNSKNYLFPVIRYFVLSYMVFATNIQKLYFQARLKSEQDSSQRVT